jgi:hypothetical protein
MRRIVLLAALAALVCVFPSVVFGQFPTFRLPYVAPNGTWVSAGHNPINLNLPYGANIRNWAGFAGQGYLRNRPYAGGYWGGNPTFDRPYVAANGTWVSAGHNYWGHPTFDRPYVAANGTWVSAGHRYGGNPTFDRPYVAADGTWVSAGHRDQPNPTYAQPYVAPDGTWVSAGHVQQEAAAAPDGKILRMGEDAAKANAYARRVLNGN